MEISAIKEIVNSVRSEIKNAFLTRAWDIYVLQRQIFPRFIRLFALCLYL